MWRNTYVFFACPCLKHFWPTRAACWSPRIYKCNHKHYLIAQILLFVVCTKHRSKELQRKRSSDKVLGIVYINLRCWRFLGRMFWSGVNIFDWKKVESVETFTLVDMQCPVNRFISFIENWHESFFFLISLWRVHRFYCTIHQN